mgnify:CR=1 FL=1|jgi:hypothetical protein
MFYMKSWAKKNAWNGNTNVRAANDIVAWMGEDIGFTQDVICDGFPELPLVSCHLTIAAVLLHNCGRANTTFAATYAHEVGARGGKKRITYCPGLPDTLPDPLPPWLGNLTLVPTPRNIYRDGS